jgi:RHS repeat-associated protein
VNIYYICRDYLGSITHVANADGSLKQELSYDAWGRLRNPATQVAYDPGSEPVLFLGRGYTGHEYLPWFGLINMNARLYDPALGRFLSPDPYVQMPDFSQNFNRYSYCLNNPLVYIDQDGEFFWTIINGVKDFLRNTFVNVWTQGFNAWSNGDNWHSTKMAWEIDKGLFKGNFKQILSRFTWELPQTILGYTASGIHNTFDGVKSVTHYGGATAVESYSEKWGAFTLGSYIIGHRGLQADPDNSLFQHEYGHYLQSQSSGLFYLQRYALPSLIDARGSSDHDYHAVEQDANIRAYKYFTDKVPGFNVIDDDRKYPNGRWYQDYNPILGYNWSLYYNDAANQLALKKGLVRPKWWDYVLGPTVVIPGIINVLNLKQ